MWLLSSLLSVELLTCSCSLRHSLEKKGLQCHLPMVADERTSILFRADLLLLVLEPILYLPRRDPFISIPWWPVAVVVSAHIWHTGIAVSTLTQQARYLCLPINECKARTWKISRSGFTTSFFSSFSSYTGILDWKVTITDPVLCWFHVVKSVLVISKAKKSFKPENQELGTSSKSEQWEVSTKLPIQDASLHRQAV